ncbi:hypothetical protein GC173_17610 [bacterium]|nr:hypothetical protein [bacterium]
MAISRAQLVNVHLVLASFFLPFALMFLVTGALYTVSIKGSYATREEVVKIEQPLVGELAPLVAQATSSLKELGMAAPSGAASVRKTGGSFELSWSGSARDIVLKPSANPGEAILVINEATAYRRLVQLHKAKGNAFAKTVSVIWAVGLFGMFASGLCMVFASPKHRRLALVSGAAGMALFVAYYFLG